jgi:hypothetical protein
MHIKKLVKRLFISGFLKPLLTSKTEKVQCSVAVLQHVIYIKAKFKNDKSTLSLKRLFLRLVTTTISRTSNLISSK